MSMRRLRASRPAGKYYTLPAIAGVQAGREYFTAMCPLALVPRLFQMTFDHLASELQIQRILNRGRLPEIAQYLVRHAKSYVLSSLTASIDSEFKFERKGETGLGYLRIPVTAQLLLHDGLHRRAAIEVALKSDPELGKETISLVLFVDPGLRRSAQIFTDLKRNEAHSARSRSIIGDERDELARLVKALVARVPVFTGQTELARSTISNRSTKLFTFSALYHATDFLLADSKQQPFGTRLRLATEFWTRVAAQIPDWSRASEHEVTTAELRSCSRARPGCTGAGWKSAIG
jgi:DNA sulfur modification protein DndB